MKKLIIGLVLLVWPVASCVADQATILGPNRVSCGRWLELQKNDVPRTLSLQGWILGYLSGVNASGVETTADFLKGIDQEAIMKWMDNYCTVHPLDSVSAATRQLINDLVKRAKK